MLARLRIHLNNRLLEVLKSSSALDLESHFTQPTINQGDVILTLPIASLLPSFSEKAISNIQNLKTDHFIKGVSLTKNQDLEPILCFSLNKNRFVQEVLGGLRNNVSSKPKKKIIVEFSSPNIAKPFHMGHLRSTIVGNFVANVLGESRQVVRMNYLGDWGTQFGFVKAGLDRLSIDDVSKLETDPLRVINRAYVLANKDQSLAESAKRISSSLESNDNDEAFSVWKKIRQLTVKHLEDTYKVLGINFDEYAWESEFTSKSFEIIARDMKEKGLVEITDNQMVLIKENKRVPLLKSDGTSLYLSRDIASALDRFRRHNCDSIKYVIDKSQEEHISNLRFAVSQLTGLDLVDHVKFGRITGMSTRLGTSVFLSDILGEVTKLMAAQQQKSPNTRDTSHEVVEALAVSTLMVYLLRQRRMRDFKFDWNLASQSTGDSGVKLQYAHSRLGSLKDSCGINEADSCKPHLIDDPEILALVLQISRYSDVISKCETDLESSHLVLYLFNLINDINRCLKKLKVKGQPSEIAEQRLLLFNSSRFVLNKGMTVLGMKPLERM